MMQPDSSMPRPLDWRGVKPVREATSGLPVCGSVTWCPLASSRENGVAVGSCHPMSAGAAAVEPPVRAPAGVLGLGTPPPGLAGAVGGEADPDALGEAGG